MEIRGKVSDRIVGLMRDMEIIHCTDISREMPAVDSDIMYTRLFGHGEHNLYQFDDAELLKIDTSTKERGGEKYISHSMGQGCIRMLDAQSI